MQELVQNTIGEKLLLQGNEAIVRGALEAGLRVATTYPGTPASEIGDTFYKIQNKAGMSFEYAINEKVALEMVIASSLCGVRSMASMKHVGVNVAADALMTFPYIGVKGGCVIVSADDPSCYSSQNEQDNRYYALFANIPMLEPSTPQEAKDMTKAAFAISEKVTLPIMLRTTTRVNHSRGIVELGKIRSKTSHVSLDWIKEKPIMMAGYSRMKHQEQLDKMEQAESMSNASEFNGIIGTGNIGIITSGVSYLYVNYAVEALSLDASILKLGMTNPLPTKLVEKFIRSVSQVIIVEELEPYLETRIKTIAKDMNANIRIFGKGSGHFSRVGEYSPDIVLNAIASIVGTEIPSHTTKIEMELPPRPPRFCPGCPYAPLFYAAKKVHVENIIFPTDIGCYTLGSKVPYEVGDINVCMGASIGMASGLSKVVDDPIIAFIGDSTFFHSGIPPLINAVHNNHTFVLVILYNGTTAMTGLQPHPGTRNNGTGTEATVSIVELVRGCGVEYIQCMNPYNIDETIMHLEKAMNNEKVTVLISQGPCVLSTLKKDRMKKIPYSIDTSKCTGCLLCINDSACPALHLSEGVVEINNDLCFPCGLCAYICPYDAISEVESTCACTPV